MKKRGIALALALFMLLANGAAAAASAPAELPAQAQLASRFEQPAFDVSAKAAVLMELESGEILYQKQAQQELPIASITKVMTLLLTMEAIEAGKISLQDTVPISEHAYSMGGSQIWLEPGEVFTLEELIKAICVSSANDAAVAVAEYVGGSEPVFVEMMNQKARQLGLSHTHFANACGLDAEGHYSSAQDVAILSCEMLKNHPQITNYTTIWMDSLRNGETQLLNTNRLLKQYAGITGLKTGTTGKAGVCITASATRDGLSLVAVILGCASSEERFADATVLLDYGFANFESAALPSADSLPQSLAVTGGTESEVKLDLEGLPQTVLVKKGEKDALTLDSALPESVQAPVQAGQNIGNVTLKVGGQTLGSFPVTAESTVEKMDFSTAFGLLLKAAAQF